MKRSSVNEKHREKYHAYFRLRSIFVFLFVIGIVGIIVSTIDITVWFIISYLLVLCSFIAVIVLHKTGRYLEYEGIYICVKSSNIVSINQYHEITRDHVKVYDSVDGAEIENTFSWEDIKQVELIDFHEDLYEYIGEETQGLMFVVDKEKLYRGIDKTYKYTDEISKRRMKLEGGFFIECKPSELADIQSYSGRKIID